MTPIHLLFTFSPCHLLHPSANNLPYLAFTCQVMSHSQLSFPAFFSPTHQTEKGPCPEMSSVHSLHRYWLLAALCVLLTFANVGFSQPFCNWSHHNICKCAIPCDTCRLIILIWSTTNCNMFFCRNKFPHFQKPWCLLLLYVTSYVIGTAVARAVPWVFSVILFDHGWPPPELHLQQTMQALYSFQSVEVAVCLEFSKVPQVEWIQKSNLSQFSYLESDVKRTVCCLARQRCIYMFLLGEVQRAPKCKNIRKTLSA